MSVAGIASEVRTDDERLVAAVRNGDDRAFEQLYGRYQRRIAAYVYGMLKDYGRAEDLTQEIFVSALRRMRATERPIAFKPWIYEIARNACIDQYRRSRRAEEVSFDAEEAAGALETAHLAGGTAPDAAVHAKQQLDDLRGAFNGLSDSHHEILVMRELEGRSYQEIGERLGLSRPSVESTLFRARKRLTEEYDELVSGERCRHVTELLADGPRTLGVREEKRLARHVAHCQPCRRQAYAAGVDTVTLTNAPRRGIARVAALLPLPAFLRLRGNGSAQWSHNLAAAAEPATGWTKAIAAAALLAAGGAGVAGNSNDPAPSVDRKAEPARVAAPAKPAGKPAADVRSENARTAALRAQARDAGAAAGSGPASVGSTPFDGLTIRPPKPQSSSTAGFMAPPSSPADPLAAVVAPPSADDLPPAGSRTPVLPSAVRGGGEPAKSGQAGGSTVNIPRSPGQAHDQVTSAVTKLDGEAGAAVDAATAPLGALGN